MMDYGKKYIYSVLLAVFFISGLCFMNTANAVIDTNGYSNGNTIMELSTKKVKIGHEFSITPLTYQKSSNKTYYWTNYYDNKYIKVYFDLTQKKWLFKGTKKGKTIIIMQLHEKDDDGDRIVLTGIYHIKVYKNIFDKTF